MERRNCRNGHIRGDPKPFAIWEKAVKGKEKRGNPTRSPGEAKAVSLYKKEIEYACARLCLTKRRKGGHGGSERAIEKKRHAKIATGEGLACDVTSGSLHDDLTASLGEGKEPGGIACSKRIFRGKEDSLE